MPTDDREQPEIIEIHQPKRDDTSTANGNGADIDLTLDEVMRTADYGGPLTESDVANYFVDKAYDQVRFDQKQGEWFRWVGTHWKQDGTKLAHEAIRRLGEAASAGKSATRMKELRKLSFARGVEAFARNDPRISVTPEIWDQNPDILGTPGGTVDLKSGAIRAANPADLISKITAVAPSFAPCQQWLTFLDQTTGSDAEMVEFLQRWCGYSLTGHTLEEQLAFLYGSGGNGKGTFITTIARIIGPYAVTAPMHIFTASEYERHSTDLAMLKGARLVTAQETKSRQKWDEERLKVLTGGDQITARFMRQDNFTFIPQFTLMMSGNHAPALDNVDDAIRRRINIVPFIRKPATVDQRLKERLFDEEGPHILGWMIEGARQWYAGGLTKPQAVREETKRYFTDQDMIAKWIAEQCRTDPQARDSLKNLLKSYQNFSGDKSMSSERLGAQLRAKGFGHTKGEQGAIYLGIKAEPWFVD